jgi:hypothetical protein
VATGEVSGVPLACDALAGPGGTQFVDLGIYASWWTNLRTEKC